jgi:anti-anti-sigma factor
MENLNKDNLNISIEMYNNVLKLYWKGVSDSRNPSLFLEPFFTELLNEVSDYKKCVFDFTDLDFMNSSTIGPLLQFIKCVRDLPLNLVLCYSQKKEWQEMSFRSMRIITNRMENVTVEMQ